MKKEEVILIVCPTFFNLVSGFKLLPLKEGGSFKGNSSVIRKLTF